MKMSYRLLFTCLLGLFFSLGSAQTVTVIPAVEPNPNADLVLQSVVPATPGIQPLAFNLKVIPEGAKIRSCKLLLTVHTPVSNKKILDLQLDPASTFPDTIENKNRRIRFFQMTAAQKADSVITLPMDNAFLAANRMTLLKVNLIFDASTAASCTFYNKKELPGKRPRLVVEYDFTPSKPLEWAQAHADAQHDRQCATEFKGALPSNFFFKKVATQHDIRQDLLVYQSNVYLVGQAMDKRVNLIRMDGNLRTQTVAATNLPNPTVTPAIDPLGRMYLSSANSAKILNLSNGQVLDSIVFGNSVPSSAPTIGPDGSVYYAMTDIVRAYAPHPFSKPIWYYSATGANGPVSLNPKGDLAYFVSYGALERQDDDMLLAINVVNGKCLYKTKVVMVNPGTTIGAVMPLVTEDGTVYLVDHLMDGKKLYAFSSTLQLLQTVNATGQGSISLPVAGHGTVGRDSTVFFMNNGSLYQATPRSSRAMTVNFKTPWPAGKGVRSIVSDRNNNVYCIVNQTQPLYFGFICIGPDYTASATTVLEITPVPIQGALVMANDGQQYTKTSTDVYAFKPDFIQPVQYTRADVQQNNRTFRGESVTVSDSLTLNVNQVLVARKQIRIGKDVTLGSNANLVIEGGTAISFGKGFKVTKGATLNCKVGY